jgi:hypothetical protein
LRTLLEAGIFLVVLNFIVPVNEYIVVKQIVKRLIVVIVLDSRISINESYNA